MEVDREIERDRESGERERERMKREERRERATDGEKERERKQASSLKKVGVLCFIALDSCINQCRYQLFFSYLS